MIINIQDKGVVYKITSPSGKVYIGQTINYKVRYAKYNNLNCKQQLRLYNSFIKNGVIYLCLERIKKKKVICTLTNKIWNTTRECAEENNINRSTLISKLSGNKINNTTYEYVYNF